MTSQLIIFWAFFVPDPKSDISCESNNKKNLAQVNPLLPVKYKGPLYMFMD